jgi:hypothetical protein
MAKKRYGKPAGAPRQDGYGAKRSEGYKGGEGFKGNRSDSSAARPDNFGNRADSRHDSRSESVDSRPDNFGNRADYPTRSHSHNSGDNRGSSSRRDAPSHNSGAPRRDGFKSAAPRTGGAPRRTWTDR